MQLTSVVFTNNAGLQAGGLLTLVGSTSKNNFTIMSCSFDSNTAVPPGTGVQYASLQYAAGAALISLSGKSSNVSATNSSFTGNAVPATLLEATNALAANVSIFSAFAVACLGGGLVGYVQLHLVWLTVHRQQGPRCCPPPGRCQLCQRRCWQHVGVAAASSVQCVTERPGGVFNGNLGALGGGAFGLINLTFVSVADSHFVNNSAGVWASGGRTRVR